MIKVLCYLLGISLLAYIARKTNPNSIDSSDHPMKSDSKFIFDGDDGDDGDGLSD